VAIQVVRVETATGSAATGNGGAWGQNEIIAEVRRQGAGLGPNAFLQEWERKYAGDVFTVNDQSTGRGKQTAVSYSSFD